MLVLLYYLLHGLYKMHTYIGQMTYLVAINDNDVCHVLTM